MLYFIVSILDVIGSNYEIPKIRWEMNHKCDSFPIKFTGIPYVWLGRQDWQCDQGKEFNIQKMHEGEKYTPTKSRRILYSTKKLQCAVKFMVKKIMVFPDYKINKNTRSKKDTISQMLRKKLKSLPDPKSDSKQIGVIQYLWQHPIDNHSNHYYIGQASGLNEPLDERVENYIKTIIKEGIIEDEEILTQDKRVCT